MHKQGKFEIYYWSRAFLLSNLIVWKSNFNAKKKSCVFVDISKLNDLVPPNFYPLLLQLEIIAKVKGYINLIVLNTASFFY